MTDFSSTPSPDFSSIDRLRVSHDDFRQSLVDLARSRQAIDVLSSLLHNTTTGAINGNSGPGLAVLLESSTQRLQVALDGLTAAAAALQIDGVQEIVADR